MKTHVDAVVLSLVLLGIAACALVASAAAMYKGRCSQCGGILVNAQGSSIFSDNWSAQCLRCGSIFAKPKER